MRQCRKLNSNSHTQLLYSQINIYYNRLAHFSSLAVGTKYYHPQEHHYTVDDGYEEIFNEHQAMVLPHIANRTSTEISILKGYDDETNTIQHALLLRSDNDNNLQQCITALNQFLDQDVIEIRPASLQPLFASIIKHIRNHLIKSTDNLDIFMDSYSSQIYIRGNDEDKQLTIDFINKLLSPKHLKIFQYLNICKNIISKDLIYELCNKYHIFVADNFANPKGSKTIQYYLSCIQQSQMHFFLTEIAKIAQAKQPHKIQKALYILRQAFMQNNINSSIYIDLKTFIAILRNISLFDLNDYDITKPENDIFTEIFNRANFSVATTSNGDRKVNFTQFAIMLCLNDEDMRIMNIQNVLKESYPSSTMSSWHAMYENEKNKSSDNMHMEASGSTAIADTNDTIAITEESNNKMVTVSLRIGDDEDTIPLFIGKHGKNLKYIEKFSGLHHIHTSYLIGNRNKEKHDSITMKGRQEEIENALRASCIVLQRIGKWYDKGKLQLLTNAFTNIGITHDLHTFDFETFEKALLSIPDIDKTKLFAAYKANGSLSGANEAEKGKMLSFIWDKFEKHKNEIIQIENGQELRLIDMVYKYCCCKKGKVWLINLNANFYCNVTPMIEFRETLPFVEAESIGNEHDLNEYEKEENPELDSKVDLFLANLSDSDAFELERINGEIIDEWYDMSTESLRSKEIVYICNNTAMSFTDSTLRQLFRHYAQCTVRLCAEANKVELIGNKYERLIAKTFLIEPLFANWNTKQHKYNVAFLLGKKGKRIQNIEKFTFCRIEVINMNESNVRIIIRGLPSHQKNALLFCEETQDILRTTIPKWSVNGIIGRHGKGLDKLQYISGADIYIDKHEEKEHNVKEVNVEIIGTKVQKSKALALLQNWGSGTLKIRFEKFKLRVTDIPYEKNGKDAEIYVKQILSPYCTVMGMDVIDYRESETFKKRSLSYFAYVWVDSFEAKMKAIHNLNNCHDINLKIWNGAPNGTVLAPAIPFEIGADEFKRNVYCNYQDVENIEIDDRTKINKYTAYIQFNNKQSFQRACEHNLQINGHKIHTFASRQFMKELKDYQFNENEYKKEFTFYLQYALDNHFNHNNETYDKEYVALNQLPKIYEKICNVPWLKNSFDSKIYKLYVTNELDDRVVLSEKEKEFAEKKYFYLKNEDHNDNNVLAIDSHIHSSRVVR